ncbi:hypothetical protein JGU72_21105 [Antrihabitans sp. YC2-6]|nr:hypothetical protein [Antrihabitans sp. YC2-6]
MIDFACSWRRFGGGPDEDILVRFGLTAHEFFGRLERILQADQHRLDEQTANELLKVCRRRLWTHRSDPTSTSNPLRPTA